MLEALIRGERNPQVLADLVKRKLRNKIPELTEALTGRFHEHHAFLARPAQPAPVHSHAQPAGERRLATLNPDTRRPSRPPDTHPCPHPPDLLLFTRQSLAEIFSAVVVRASTISFTRSGA
jgi:hypothetical protein